MAVTSWDPLRIYVYEEGLVRFATKVLRLVPRSQRAVPMQWYEPYIPVVMTKETPIQLGSTQCQRQPTAGVTASIPCALSSPMQCAIHAAGVAELCAD